MSFNPVAVRERRAEREAEFGRKITAGKYGVIIADVPNSGRIGEYADKHCLLLLGCRSATLVDGVAQLKASGFTYKSHFCQVLSTYGPFDGFVKDNAITWLLAVKGKGRIPAPAMGTQWPSWLRSDDPKLMNRFAAEFFPSVPTIDLRESAHDRALQPQE